MLAVAGATTTGWLAAARALHVSLTELEALHDMMPEVARSWKACGGGAMAVPVSGGSGSFKNSWQTLTYFDEEEGKFFETGNYETMRDDTRRTPIYFDAIQQRLAASPHGTLAVCDLGTGPFALLALEAARAGARRVYAIEHQPLSAQLARDTIAAAGFDHVVTVIEGKSTEVCLPERVDLLISEVVGSVASEEGLYATIADAHARHVKRPTDPRSWIPHRVQTLAAPCSYALHYALGLPAYDCMMRGASEPFLVREGPGQQPAFQPR